MCRYLQLKAARQILLSAVFAVCGACLVLSAQEAGTGKNVPSEIQWDEKDGKYVAEAADILTRCLRKCTGAEPEKGCPHILLQVRPDNEADPESFRIDFPEQGRVVITGATALAVRHGACEFLERFYGVRWLFPGEEGEYIPENVVPVFPAEPVVMSPAYRIRTFTFTHKAKAHYAWAGRNRGNFNFDFRTLPGRPWFQHNLNRLLPQEEYTKTNPEFFPFRKETGERYLPRKDENVYWQYCFTAPGIREAFIRAIQKDLQDHPDLFTVSLGVNDGGRFCECDRCLELDAPYGKDTMGHDRRTLSYLECMDAVVRQCQAPGRTFGFLAYHSLRVPPENRTFHSSLVPFLTYEKTYWADPRLRQEDQELTSAWLRACGSVGWYDYLEYSHFLIPKISLKVLPEALKWGAANGVKYYYSEAYPAPDWHTGPMLWLILKLTWDPSLSADALLKEWCEAAVGKEAAVPLEKYYRACSDYWETKLTETDFFRERRQYLPFGSSGYLEKVDGAWLDRRREELLQTVALASPQGIRRAGLILQGFLKREPAIRLYIRNAQLRKQLDVLDFRVTEKFDFNRDCSWPTWQRKTGSGTFFHDPQEGIGRSGAAAMDLKGSFKDMCYLKEIGVKPGFVYRITVYVRTVGTDPSCVVGLNAAWSAPGKAQLDPAYNAHEKLTEDSSFRWRRMSIPVTAPQIENCRLRIVLSAGGSAGGRVFFDDLTVEEAAPGPQKD